MADPARSPLADAYAAEHLPLVEYHGGIVPLRFRIQRPSITPFGNGQACLTSLSAPSSR